MQSDLHGKKVAILVADGFEQIEMISPRRALEEAGAETILISPSQQRVRSADHDEPGEYFPVDLALSDAAPGDFDALMLPGGVANPDKLRIIGAAVDFARTFFEEGKPIAAICHAPWLLVEAGVVKGRMLTSWPSLKTDIINAGGDWVNEEVVVDKGLVTSRSPDDLPAFNRKMIEEIAEGIHRRRGHAGVSA